MSQSYVPWSPQPQSTNGTDVAVFGLKYLEGTRIRSCYGCGSPIRTDTSYLPSPPHDIVISYRERRYYRDPSTKEMRLSQQDENTYYHCMLKCVQLKHPLFCGYMLKVTIGSLKEIHLVHLREQFGI